MAATVRQFNTLDVTAELWRVAESGDLDGLLCLLPRINDINAGNRHGTTALMKAAFYGHEPVVRALLERGADPNLTRTDKFTALALAAFFGHAETVKTLIEYGARAEAVTRAGASARTWAIARTFDEVARCLESHTPKPITLVPPPAPVSRTPVAAATVEVKTLKDPPEIWDLVKEAPRTFDPRSAFLARIMSMKKTFAVGACAAVLLVVGCSVGALMLRSSQPRSVPQEIAPAPVAAQATVSSPQQPAEAVVESPPVDVQNANHVRAVPNKGRLIIRQPRTAAAVSETPVETTVQSREAPAVAAPQIESQKPSAPAVKSSPNTALSPQLITGSKNAPPKGKVIQWP
jgi:hypothetical protein